MAKHYIQLMSEAVRAVSSAPYRAGLKEDEFEKKKSTKTLFMNDTEPAK